MDHYSIYHCGRRTVVTGRLVRIVWRHLIAAPLLFEPTSGWALTVFQ